MQISSPRAHGTRSRPAMLSESTTLICTVALIPYPQNTARDVVSENWCQLITDRFCAVQPCCDFPFDFVGWHGWRPRMTAGSQDSAVCPAVFQLAKCHCLSRQTATRTTQPLTCSSPPAMGWGREQTRSKTCGLR